MPLFVNALQPIEWRYTNDPSWVMRDKGERLDYNRVWVKADGVMPDDLALHTATMLYCSDTTVLDLIITTHGLSWGFDRIFAATVNHSVWFHRQVNLERLGVVFHIFAGGYRFTRAWHRLLLRPLRAAGRHRRTRRRGEVFPRFETVGPCDERQRFDCSTLGVTAVTPVPSVTFQVV